MKKLFIVFTLFLSVSQLYSQVIDQKQITEMSKAYMNAGDTVGIYAFSDGQKQLMDPIKYTGMKMNTLGAALSYGIAKTKMKLEYAGSTSPYIFTSTAHFILYFGMVPASKAMSLYMFSNNYSIRDFAVSKFVVKKNKRQLVQGTYSLWSGSDTGVKTDDTVKITSKQLRDGVYDVTVSAQPGEYCFVFTNNGTGGFNSVFDFTIK
jgi:hypothetical protein